MICVPIVESNIEDAVAAAEEALKLADLVEFRADYFTSLEREDVVRMAEYPAIITIRAPWEGGRYSGNPRERIRLYELAIEHNAAYIDVELKEKMNRHLVSFRDSVGSKTKIIISYHDFSKTPGYPELSSIVEGELRIGDVGKFATMVNTKEDILTVLRVTLDFSGRVIGVGMGEKGKITRVLAPYFGSVLTYSSMNGKTSAPGQMDVLTLKRCREVLGL
ncbi:MAG TPA: type I 3-dehydroquinate dehydratase [Euryarchaeota archaeon]|nr:type I 3-dehydroquinate dehydratase [Euryarchaeota archaeon]